MKKKNKTTFHLIAKHIKSTPVSVAIDILVILSIALNVYSLYQSTKMDKSLNTMDNMLELMNQTLIKNMENLDAHMKATYPDILAAHMQAANGMPIETNDNTTCINP